MKPRRLEMEGFGSFRDRTVIDFAGADLFALTGPTGAGKSTVIDAITFALYGAVPRYEKENLVWPVVTQGMQEARVRFDFTVGEESYTAVRVVRRTAQGRATTRRAVLERGGVVIADSAKELGNEVQRVLGLPFGHFTKCVVLPQGDFARFLHDEGSRRQDLLVKLLDLEIYDEMARAANARAAESEGEATWRRRRLEEDLAAATEQAKRDRVDGAQVGGDV
ncbi:MAG: SMC family ATPase, partial [Thermoanaerobaculia bacterium]|nr:SMC family ATPase [Thermoanaerobaculia bacterium]